MKQKKLVLSGRTFINDCTSRTVDLVYSYVNPFTPRHPLSGWYDVPTLKAYNSRTELDARIRCSDLVFPKVDERLEYFESTFSEKFTFSRTKRVKVFLYKNGGR